MTASSAAIPATIRDPRLDFYRGIAMFIIMMAHTPGNLWNQWIPARFGFSDAAEVFVFCSGMASAIAFGRTFDRRGWFLGTSRIVFRVWQIYWAHIATFMVTAVMLAALDSYGSFDKSYIGSLNLGRFFSDPQQQLIGLFTLTYVPNYFDILPMYMVVLLMMPIIMALSQINRWCVLAFVTIIWALAQEELLQVAGIPQFQINLPAEPWAERPWFINPFAWQLVFFTGFAFVRGWLPAPTLNPFMIALVAVILIASFLVSNIGLRLLDFDWARAWRTDYQMLFDKTNGGILRYVHFLALAYFAWAVAGPQGRFLIATGETTPAKLWRFIVAQISKVGQQSLAVFVVSMVSARLAGFVLDRIGNDWHALALVNFASIGLLLSVAYGAAWFKSQPWKGISKQ